jgi:3-oxoacyl-[acyl-carrier-protein] synthase-3
MQPASLRSSRIIGTGRYLPERVLSNFDLEKMVETSDEWIVTRTGIRERRIAAENEACSDLSLAASQQALAMAGMDAKDLDGIIVGTISGDMQFPATATFVQDRLGAVNAAALDLSAACSGFIYGLNMGNAMIASGQMDRVLVVGAEVLTKFVDWTDRSTCVLFGDAAGAAILEPCAVGEGILATHMKSDGALAELLCLPGGGSRNPLTPNTFAERTRYIKMKGDGVFKWAVRAMVDASHHVLARAGCTLSDVALIIPHQANIRIIEAVAERLDIPRDRIVVNLDRYGNTSSATIPVAYDEVTRNGKLKQGDLVLFTGFGGGFTWGSVLLRHAVKS